MQNIRLEELILIDIETVSAQNQFHSLNNNWQQLWQEKVIKMLPPNISIEEMYEQKAGVMAEFSKIVCVSIGYFKKEPKWELRIKSFFGEEEKLVLQNFMNAVSQMHRVNDKWIFAGHNIKEFDIPFLCRRLLVNHFAIPDYLNFQNKKPWETNIVDTFQYWRFGDYKNFTSLNLLAACLGIASPKDDMDGSMVGKIYWQEKDIERIATYCQKDIATVANIILRFKNMDLFTENQIRVIAS